ncbi:MAG TPA: DUF642 domain-containing protein [Chthoniobacterales bacterium]
MKTRGRLAWKVCAALLALTAQADAQNLLVNGGFELNDRSTYANYYPTEDLAYLAQPDVLPGWSFGHSVDLYGAARAPQSGSQFLDLVGGGPLTQTFFVEQAFATTPGQVYALSFYYGNNENLATALATFTASVIGGSGTLWTQSFSHTGDTYSARNWAFFTTLFTANSASTILRFLDTSGFATDYNPSYTVGGSTLDNVAVIAAVPEPGGILTAVLIGGFCCLPLLRRLRTAAR